MAEIPESEIAPTHPSGSKDQTVDISESQEASTHSEHDYQQFPTRLDLASVILASLQPDSKSEISPAWKEAIEDIQKNIQVLERLPPVISNFEYDEDSDDNVSDVNDDITEESAAMKEGQTDSKSGEGEEESEDQEEYGDEDEDDMDPVDVESVYGARTGIERLMGRLEGLSLMIPSEEATRKSMESKFQMARSLIHEYNELPTESQLKAAIDTVAAMKNEREVQRTIRGIVRRGGPPNREILPVLERVNQSSPLDDGKTPVLLTRTSIPSETDQSRATGSGGSKRRLRRGKGGKTASKTTGISNATRIALVARFWDAANRVKMT